MPCWCATFNSMQVRDGDTARLQGISLLEAKMHLVLEYDIHLAYLALRKAEGHSIKDHPVVGACFHWHGCMKPLTGPCDA